LDRYLWRREYKGKKQSDLAEEALTLFYKAKKRKMQSHTLGTRSVMAVKALPENRQVMRAPKKRKPMTKHT
jgi:hypothetical protein